MITGRTKEHVVWVLQCISLHSRVLDWKASSDVTQRDSTRRSLFTWMSSRVKGATRKFIQSEKTHWVDVLLVLKPMSKSMKNYQQVIHHADGLWLYKLFTFPYNASVMFLITVTSFLENCLCVTSVMGQIYSISCHLFRLCKCKLGQAEILCVWVHEELRRPAGCDVKVQLLAIFWSHTVVGLRMIVWSQTRITT